MPRCCANWCGCSLPDFANLTRTLPHGCRRCNPPVLNLWAALARLRRASTACHRGAVTEDHRHPFELRIIRSFARCNCRPARWNRQRSELLGDRGDLGPNWRRLRLLLTTNPDLEIGYCKYAPRVRKHEPAPVSSINQTGNIRWKAPAEFVETTPAPVAVRLSAGPHNERSAGRLQAIL